MDIYQSDGSLTLHPASTSLLLTICLPMAFQQTHSSEVPRLEYQNSNASHINVSCRIAIFAANKKGAGPNAKVR